MYRSEYQGQLVWVGHIVGNSARKEGRSLCSKPLFTDKFTTLVWEGNPLA